MRSIWNGAISFGLVSIPIKLVNATESRSVSFRQVHTEDGGRIRYRKVCELDGEEVAPAEIGKAYEDADGTMIPITDEDLAALPLPTARTIEIVAFVPAGEIDPLQMDAAYYLSANGVPAAKPYTLLREALKRSEKVAVAKYALRGRERLGMLRVVDDVIAMHGLLWPDEIRAPEGVAPETPVSVREAELDLADALMATLGEVDISSLHDDYRTAVEEMIAAKAEGGEGVPAAEPGEEPGGQVIDLMAALESSVRAAREARGEDAVVTELKPRGTPKETGGKKSTSRAPAKKTAAARKSTAKPASGAAGKARAGTPAKTTSKAASKTASSGAASRSASKAASASTSRSSSGTTSKSTSKTASKSTAKKATPRKRTA
ncbi:MULTISPECIES: Ku protein [unclassified Streptomyces]|uniref:non-homologous end joining protein Ku n=1 Tax=unclassified Streptomyces TaxID=2593676 RepID=UPI0006F58818|nr:MULTISPECIES: Ku protein [unclassified Streptomyces]KQX47303.1 DNA repair protein [Streptomyces sp. Root1304]KRA94610.1 DNA repair protein [Streptomyces sp. Root66D1]